jgi:hypothetical protein
VIRRGNWDQLGSIGAYCLIAADIVHMRLNYTITCAPCLVTLHKTSRPFYIYSPTCPMRFFLGNCQYGRGRALLITSRPLHHTLYTSWMQFHTEYHTFIHARVELILIYMDKLSYLSLKTSLYTNSVYTSSAETQ